MSNGRVDLRSIVWRISSRSARSPLPDSMARRSNPWSWRFPARRTIGLIVSLGGGLACLLAGFLSRSSAFASAVFINVGTSLLLVAVIVKLEQDMAVRVASKVAQLISEQLRATPPQTHTPVWATATDERQRALQAARPLDASAAETLATAFGVERPHRFRIAVPVAPDIHTSLAALGGDLAATVQAVQRQQLARSGRGLTQTQAAALAQLYDYTRFESRRVESLSHLGDVDVVLVAGARGKAIGDRIDCALDIARKAQRLPTILFAGGHASYDTAKPGFSEAAAMAEIARNHEAGQLLERERKLLLEERSQTMWENISLSFRLLQPIRAAVGRPLEVVLVTAPYALRRFWLIAEEQWEDHRELVGNVWLAHGVNNWDLTNMLALAESVATRAQTGSEDASFGAGIARWMDDYFKLFGGRAAGEF